MLGPRSCAGTITAISFLSTPRYCFQEFPHSPHGIPASPGTTMAKRSRTYIWQFTIGLGFTQGSGPRSVLILRKSFSTSSVRDGRDVSRSPPTATVHPPSSHPPRPSRSCRAYRKGEDPRAGIGADCLRGRPVHSYYSLDLSESPPCGNRDRVSCHRPPLVKTNRHGPLSFCIARGLRETW